jgi:hypothetical protein
MRHGPVPVRFQIWPDDALHCLSKFPFRKKPKPLFGERSLWLVDKCTRRSNRKKAYRLAAMSDKSTLIAPSKSCQSLSSNRETSVRVQSRHITCARSELLPFLTFSTKASSQTSFLSFGRETGAMRFVRTRGHFPTGRNPLSFLCFSCLFSLFWCFFALHLHSHALAVPSSTFVSIVTSPRPGPLHSILQLHYRMDSGI